MPLSRSGGWWSPSARSRSPPRLAGQQCVEAEGLTTELAAFVSRLERQPAGALLHELRMLGADDGTPVAPRGRSGLAQRNVTFPRAHGHSQGGADPPGPRADRHCHRCARRGMPGLQIAWRRSPAPRWMRLLAGHCPTRSTRSKRRISTTERRAVRPSSSSPGSRPGLASSACGTDPGAQSDLREPGLAAGARRTSPALRPPAAQAPPLTGQPTAELLHGGQRLRGHRVAVEDRPHGASSRPVAGGRFGTERQPQSPNPPDPRETASIPSRRRFAVSVQIRTFLLLRTAL